MIPMKRVPRTYKKRNRVSTIEYVTVFGLFSVLVMAAAAAAATHTEAGHAFLSDAIRYLFG